jgi:hypothetical protein
MKKRPILLCLLLTCVLCMGFQCEPRYDMLQNHGMWLVKNTTGQSLWIRPANYDRGAVELAPGAEVPLWSQRFDIWTMPDFASLAQRWEGFTVENIHFDVLSEDGTPLVRWNYAESEGAVRHFFDERSWRRTDGPGPRVDEVEVEWIFEVVEADLKPAAEVEQQQLEESKEGRP